MTTMISNMEIMMALMAADDDMDVHDDGLVVARMRQRMTASNPPN